MAKGQKVFIADHVPELLNLFGLLLRGEGYETATGAMDTPLMEAVKRFDPDAILVDLILRHNDDLLLLDQLRTNPTTRATPVVAMSTMPDALAQAVASYNVRQVLLKPFNVEDLQEKVRAAIERSSLLALLKAPLRPVDPLFAEVAMSLAGASRDMVIRWVQRVAATEPFRSRKLDLAAAIDEVPILIEAMLVALQSAGFRAMLAQHPAIRDKVIEHVKLRRSQGIPLADVVREYQYMRDEIRCEIARIFHGRDVTAAETLEMVTRTDFALDTIVGLNIDAYEELEAAK